MATVVNLDGVLLAKEEAMISIFDRGFLYGDSIFETLRTYAGRPFALRAHWLRLERSASLVHMAIPIDYEEIERRIELSLEKAANSDSYIRIMVTRGEGPLGLDPALAIQSRVIVIVGELKLPPASFYEEGIAVISYQCLRPTDDTAAAGAKIGNYLVAVLANQAAIEAGAKDAIIVDGNSKALEGATSNLFYVEGEVIYTPPLSSGVLGGITRRLILEAAQRNRIQVIEETPKLERLLKADEIFLSSSIREIAPVIMLDGQMIGRGKPGDVTQRVINAIAETVASGWEPLS